MKLVIPAINGERIDVVNTLKNALHKIQDEYDLLGYVENDDGELL